jgi:uncharacterized membrane protein (DUF4010 family)
MIASAMVYARVIAEAAIVAPGQWRAMLPPLVAMFGASAVISAGLFFLSRDRHAEMAEQGNPADLRLAMTFAAIYAVVSFAVAAVQAEFGVQALYPVALLAGLTDVDAVTLSSSQLVAQGRLDTGIAWRMILVASLSNLAFKGAMVAVIGGRALFRYLAPAFAVAIAAGTAILWAWPGA